MKTRQCIQSRVGLGLMAVAALLLVLLPTEARAAIVCPTTETNVDTDGDGFTDFQECSGITLGDNTRVPLDPTKKDIFILLVPLASGSRLPTEPLAFISALGITVHQITSSQVLSGTARNVTNTQKAIRMAESSDTNGTDLATSNYGTPNQLDGGTIFTQRIFDKVQRVYSGVGLTCTTACLNDVNRLIKHAIAHESAHMMRRTDTYVKQNGGYHYKTGTEIILEQDVVATTSGTGATAIVSISIPAIFASQDQTGAVLK